jgi:hypothetical protein
LINQADIKSAGGVAPRVRTQGRIGAARIYFEGIAFQREAETARRRASSPTS